MNSRFYLRGFTLVELMVIVAIAAILAGLTAPSFTNVLRNSRASSAAAALQVSLSLARSEAVRRGSNARVSVAANTAPGVWGSGWKVFADASGNANAGLAPTTDTSTTTILEQVAALPSSVEFGQTGTLTYFTYDGRGRIISSNGGPGNRSFWFFDNDSKRYCVIINVSGRVRSESVASGASCVTD